MCIQILEMTQISYQMLRVSKMTAQRIKSYNKGNSYDENISIFLDYFERTGVNPAHLKENSIEVTLKGFDRVISIIKSIEKIKLDPILNRVASIEKLMYDLGNAVNDRSQNVSNSNSNSPNIIGGGEGQLSEEELQAILKVNADQDHKISELQKEIKRLNHEKFELSQHQSQSSGEDMENLKAGISHVIKRLDDGLKKSTFTNDYTIKYGDYKFVFDSLRNLIK